MNLNEAIAQILYLNKLEGCVCVSVCVFWEGRRKAVQKSLTFR